MILFVLYENIYLFCRVHDREGARIVI